MNKLEKMIESCEEFEKNPVTGDYKWNIGRCTDYSTRTNIGLVKFWLLDNGEFYYRISDANNVKLKSETAKEAAFEALELAKAEAQKLVNALSEPKEYWIKIDPNNLPENEVLAINKVEVEILAGKIVRANTGNYLRCVSEDDVLINPTHYLEYETILKLIPKP